MGDLLLHCTVVWINPPGSLLKGKKEPELAAFGMSQNILHKYRQILSKKKKKKYRETDKEKHLGLFWLWAVQYII